MKVLRYRRVEDCPDRTTYDVCYVDLTTGREVLRYDGADPANTNRDYGGMSGSEHLLELGVDPNEMVDESWCVPDVTWAGNYTPAERFDDWDGD